MSRPILIVALALAAAPPAAAQGFWDQLEEAIGLGKKQRAEQVAEPANSKKKEPAPALKLKAAPEPEGPAERPGRAKAKAGTEK